MTNRNLTLASTEYEQLGENLRATWGYISDLIKMWVISEVLAIILVLICYHFHQIHTVPEASITKFFVCAALFALLACMLSFGAAAQNGRLFNSAIKFVERASFIEEQSYFDPQRPNNRNISSQLFPFNAYGTDWSSCLRE